MSKYTDMLKRSGAKVGDGLNTLARMAGGDLRISQGHHELPASNRSPLNPGHSKALDRTGHADFEGQSAGNFGK